MPNFISGKIITVKMTGHIVTLSPATSPALKAFWLCRDTESKHSGFAGIQNPRAPLTEEIMLSND